MSGQDEIKTDDDLMREAFNALLRGDTAERDRVVSILKARQKLQHDRQVRVAQAAAPYFPKH